MRIEKDLLGELKLPKDYYFGINTKRAENNFNFNKEIIRSDLFHALITVKLACARANHKAELLETKIFNAIEEAINEILVNIELFIPSIHPLQGGAGTSTNMAANELIANIALKKMSYNFGDYHIISPLNHINLSQSTNDVYPTALRIAIIKLLKNMHKNCEFLLKKLLQKEKEYSNILKIGRTELQDAMPMSAGQQFSAYAGAISRFRWRLNKAVDWIREVNISGTAIGTSINADSEYSSWVIEELRQIVQLPLSLSKNLIDATQNCDQLVEIFSIIKTGAVSIKKISADLRLLSSGPQCGLGEIKLSPLQAGSTIMPGKVNPVMAEAAEQVCINLIASDNMISIAASETNLELPQFLPLIGHTMLNSMEIFSNMMFKFGEMIESLELNIPQLQKNVKNSFAIATLLSPAIGYEKASQLIKKAKETNKPIVEIILEEKLIPKNKLEKLLEPKVMASPGLPVLEEEEDEK